MKALLNPEEKLDIMIARKAWGGQAVLGCSLRPYSSSATGSPTVPSLLLKLRSDLKTAMKTKDTNRYITLISMDYVYC